jgi:hypothetical protein
MKEKERRRRNSRAKKRTPAKAGEPIHLAGVTYQLRWVKCGKPNCIKKHGPYWYAFTKVGGRVHTRYVGKKLPVDVERFGR